MEEIPAIQMGWTKKFLRSWEKLPISTGQPNESSINYLQVFGMIETPPLN